MHFIIVGASRGLGAALVEACLRHEGSFVIGIGRSVKESVDNYEKWAGGGRFQYCRLDITEPAGRGALVSICNNLPKEKVCIIFNAAKVKSDLREDGGFIYDVYNDLVLVGISGFGLIIDVFAEHLRRYNGIFVGISSLSSWVPPVLEKRIAYPASKAFLNMALRSMRIAWGDSVKIVTVIIGNMGNNRFRNAPQWLVPTYISVAEKIITALSGRRVPSTLLIPLPVCMAYKILGILPDSFSKWSLLRAKGLLGKILKKPIP